MKQYASNAVYVSDSNCTEDREAAIPAALHSAEMALSSLEANVEMLLKRLHPILLSEPPSDALKGECRPLHSVPLAEQLTRIQERVEMLNLQTLGVYRRIEL